MSGINGVTVAFRRVYGCVTVALMRKLREFYGCVIVVHLRHVLVRRIWTTHFSILIRSPLFQGRTAFGMSSVTSTLEITLFSLHGGYVVPFPYLGLWNIWPSWRGISRWDEVHSFWVSECLLGGEWDAFVFKGLSRVLDESFYSLGIIL